MTSDYIQENYKSTLKYQSPKKSCNDLDVKIIATLEIIAKLFVLRTGLEPVQP